MQLTPKRKKTCDESMSLSQNNTQKTKSSSVTEQEYSQSTCLSSEKSTEENRSQTKVTRSMIQKQIDEAISLNEIEFDVPVYFTDLCINPDIVNHKDYEHIIKKSYHESDKSKMNLLYPINLHKSFHPILYFNPTKYPPSTEKFKKKEPSRFCGCTSKIHLNNTE